LGVLQVSDEGKKWKDVECGRTYDANDNQATLVRGFTVIHILIKAMTALITGENTV
jgi:hypothetical protein